MKYTEEEVEIIKNNYGKRPIREWINLLPGRTLDSIQSKAKRLGLLSSVPPRNRFSKKPKYLDLKIPPEDKDIEAIWLALENYQEKCRLLSTHQDEVTIRIDTDEPIVVVFLSDLHIGAISGYYKELRETIDILSKTDNCYIISCGDTVDNYLPTFHSTGQFGVVCPPEIQKALIEYLFKKLYGKLIALVQGCHDEASHYADDFDWTKHLAKRLECANLGFGGMVHLYVGKQVYHIMARHKYRFNSSFNVTHTVKRMREQIGDFDIGVVAHHHKASIEQTEVAGLLRLFIRPGSFKGPDRYTRQRGFTVDSKCYMPAVILYPNERKMLPFLHLRDALLVLDSLKKD